MKVTSAATPDVLFPEPRVFGDARFFFERLNQNTFDEAVGRHAEFVQHNNSRSARGVLRDSHHQLAPHAQGKRACDQRTGVRSRDGCPRQQADRRQAGRHRARCREPYAVSTANVHGAGFLVMSECDDSRYKAPDFHAPIRDRSIRFDDPAIGTTWPLDDFDPSLSFCDCAAPPLARGRTVQPEAR